MTDIDFSSPFERYSTVLHVTEVANHKSKFDFEEILHEAPEDEGGGDNDNATVDTNTDPEDEGFEEAPANDNNNDNNDQPANEDNDDFTIDASDDNMDAEGGGDTSGGGGENSSPETQNTDVDNAAKQKDREIFDTLSPQEQKIKTVKLKELFMDLYNRCDQISDKMNSIGVEYEDLGYPIHHSIEALYGLKQMISTYLLYLFDSKSYIENDITFNRFLTALNQIKLITKDMRDAHKEDIELQINTDNK